MAEKNPLNKQLLDIVYSMKQEGLVDDHFMYVYSLRENSKDPFYLADVIPEFCSNAREVLNQLTQALNNPHLNCNVTREYIYKVKGSALSLGACRMVQAFVQFERALDKASHEQCMIALNRAKNEYASLEEKLHAVLQTHWSLAKCPASPKPSPAKSSDLSSPSATPTISPSGSASSLVSTPPAKSLAAHSPTTVSPASSLSTNGSSPVSFPKDQTVD